MGLLTNLINCIWQTPEQKKFNTKVREYGLNIAIEYTLQKLHETIPSQEMAMKFILQELDFAQQEQSLPQNFINNSGFHPLEYDKTLLRFKESEAELLKTQNIFDAFLRNINNNTEITNASIKIMEGIMSKWEIGKYAPAREEGEEEEEKIEPKEIETPIAPEPMIEEVEEPIKSKTIQYDSKRVNTLMEEYSDIIGDIITGKANEKEEKRIKEFKEHISKASIEGKSDHAIVLSCFYEHKEPYNETLPIPATKMNGASLNFLQSILKGFEKQGFSEVFLDYAKENKEVVYKLAKQ